MLQLNPPLPRVIVGGKGWAGPVGKGIANFIEPGHLDEDVIWMIDLNDGGQTWCVPNRYVRAPVNMTQGRTADTSNGQSHPSHNGSNGQRRVGGERLQQMLGDAVG